MFHTAYIASDHNGVLLKEQLIGSVSKISIVDLGTKDSHTSVDYPDYAKSVAKFVSFDESACGILICKSGVGMCIAANKHRGIRGILCDGNLEIIKLSREHNDCNVICFGAESISFDKAMECFNLFVNTCFSHEARHQHRIEKMQ
jgi:ribose 5-phosphate isomerase B